MKKTSVGDFEPLIVLDDLSGTYAVTLFRDQLVGLHALIHWLDGFCKSGQGRVPGAQELVMHYRSLRSSLLESPPAGDAVDPHVSSTGKPSTRERSS